MTTTNKPDVQAINRTLVSAVTQFDLRTIGKRGHNPYALPQYFQRIDEICADIEAGADTRKAITAGFSGRLADCCLRSLGLSITTNEEARGGSLFYKPSH